MRWHDLAFALLFVAGRAAAADFTPDPIDVAAAKEEGSVVWYTSTPVEMAQLIANRFEAETGIKVELFRTGGSALLRRFMAEIDAGRVAADLLTMSDGAAARALAARGVLVPFKPEGFDKVVDEAKDPDGRFMAQRLTLITMLVRTDKVAKADWPRDWSDLTQPKYKGLMVMPDPSFTAIQLMVVGTLSQRLGWSFYEQLHKNDVMIVQGHEQVYEMVRRGERVIAAEGADPRTYTRGQPVPDIATIVPAKDAIFVPSPMGVVKGGPHPAAAKLFEAFQLRPEIQKLYPPAGIHAGRADIDPPAGLPRLSDLKLLAIDFDDIEKHAPEIKDRFNEIFQ